MTSSDIKLVLKKRHENDIFITECKTGPTVKGVLKLDAWAMKPSWSNPLTIGYEIKVSKQDFLNDNKWHKYLDYCHEFYFVCPKDLIKVEEVPEGIGLIYIIGSRVLIKRLSKSTPPSKLEDLYKYVLMYHSGLLKDQARPLTKEERALRLLERVEEFKKSKTLYINVSDSLRETIAKKIVEVDRENQYLKKDIERYEQIKLYLDSLGINVKNLWTHAYEKQISERLDELERGFSSEFLYSLDTLKHSITKIQEHIINKDKKNS